MNWHADDAVMSAYLQGRLDPVGAASVEQHLWACSPCRAALAAAAPLPQAELDGIWLGIRETIESPAPTLVERLAIRLGVPESDARLLAAAPSLRPSWLTGLVAASALALVAAWVGDPEAIALFLIVAPLAPLAGIAMAFGPHADPAHEVVAAAPYPALRLLLLRAAAVLLTSIPVVAVTAALLPLQEWVAVGWLLPALAFSLGALALSRWLSVEHASAGIACGWTTLVLLAAAQRNASAVLGPGLQFLYLCLALIACAVIFSNTRHPFRR
jgi:hypothetical protein